MDLNYQRDTTSGQEGLQLLDDLNGLENTPPVVVMTAWGSVELAVEAIQKGASDFIEKPWDNLRLLQILKAQLDLNRSRKQSARFAASYGTKETENPFIASSSTMLELLETLKSIARSDASVLLTGENGTGKNLLASMLHRMSDRNDQPFVTMDVGAITETLFESELFGHTRGAFTDARENRVGRLELADGGTLFLDEIANLAPAQQNRLLRVLESGEYERVGSSQTRHTDIRFVAATNADIEALVDAGDFRRDLFYRLNTIMLRVPPLRERIDDIRVLAEHFLQVVSRKYRKTNLAFSGAAMQVLVEYEWPGNIRQLSHAIERAVLVVKGSVVEADHLGLEPTATSTHGDFDLRGLTLAEMEHRLIERTLIETDYNVSQAAAQLDISRSSLYRKMEMLESQRRKRNRKMSLFRWISRQYQSENHLLWAVAISWLPVIYFYVLFAADHEWYEHLLWLSSITGGYGLVLWYLRRTLRRPLLTLSNLLLSMQGG